MPTTPTIPAAWLRALVDDLRAWWRRVTAPRVVEYGACPVCGERHCRCW